MYVPRHFAETDVARLHALVRAYPFAILVSLVDGTPFATHLPLVLDTARGRLGTLAGHVARPNPHARAFDGGSAALAIFAGPHAYVSPRWYAGARNVPTWNYVAVHASGRPRVVEDPAAVRASLARAAETFEPAGAEAVPWRVESMPDDYASGMQRGIVAFELEIDRLVGKRKLSQNRAEADRAGVVAGLLAEGGPEGAAVAALMESAG